MTIAKINPILGKKYADLAVGEKAGEFLFKWQDARNIIDYLARENVVVVGMNFWIQKGSDIIEINSTNYDDINSGQNAVENTTKAAARLIREGLPDKADYVSFVLNEQSNV